ncbi:hypothetical protein JCM19235_1217 [Vibrio maritimus]|uniref:Uncharacterized protein n=1 Tax=Vibrio maritimus TaxID=990268 RepID=A0A090S5U8_9VIBR|nr:hypothetical protein JCM19235_1217 [Vibrio maritimus]
MKTILSAPRANKSHVSHLIRLALSERSVIRGTTANVLIADDYNTIRTPYRPQRTHISFLVTQYLRSL